MKLFPPQERFSGSREATAVGKATVDLEWIRNALEEFGSPLFWVFENTLAAQYGRLKKPLRAPHPFGNLGKISLTKSGS